MSALPAAPLLLSLLMATSAPALPLSEERDTPGTRHLKLTSENAREQHPVRISPGHPTNLVFADAPLRPGGVEVEGGAVAVAVNEALGMVTLLPSDTLPGDQPLTVKVHFADGLVPGSVTFRLVVHATRAEHHVRVHRQTHSCESHWQEARQQRERAERCEAALEQACPRPEGPRPGDFTDLFDAGLVGKGQGVMVRNLGKDSALSPAGPFEVKAAWSYRAEKLGRVAVELWVENTGPRPWRVEEVEAAKLVSPTGVRLRVVRVWQSEPLAPGAHARLVVEAEATVEQAQGTFSLKLGAAGGARALTVDGVTFP